MPSIKTIGFVVYPVSNMKRSRAFYEKTLGLKVTMKYSDKWVEYDIGPTTFAISTMMKDCKPGARGATAALEVDDFDVWVKRLEKMKATFKLGAFETPVCWMAVFADPDGNSIILHHLKS